MGLFEKIFTRAEAQKSAQTFFKELNGYTPSFNSWGGQLYESELVRSSVDAIARHSSKLKIATKGNAKKEMKKRLIKAPNTFQTWGQFLYRTATVLNMQGTAFIVPEFGAFDEVLGVHVIKPNAWALVKVEKNNEPWVRFTFDGGRVASARLAEVGILTRFQYEDDFFGTKNNALSETMELINIQNQGINEATKSSASYRFMAKVTNFTKPEDLANERKRFSRENLENGGGLLLFPNTYGDIKQITSTPYTIDTPQRELIQKNVFNYFGVNEEILQNKATPEQMDAFFNGAIEPFEIQLADVLTKMLFTERERENGNAIEVNANRLQYMTVASKIQLVKELGDRGFITVNEGRELFNYPMLEDEIGDKIPIRGEFYFVNEKKEEETNNED